MDRWIEGWVDVWMDGGVAGSLPCWLTGWIDVWMHLRILIWKVYGKQDSIRKKLKMKKMHISITTTVMMDRRNPVANSDI